MRAKLAVQQRMHTISKKKMGLSIREEQELDTHSASNSWYKQNDRQMNQGKRKLQAKETRTQILRDQHTRNSIEAAKKAEEEHNQLSSRQKNVKKTPKK